MAIGKFVTFEGPEGSGKSTACKLVIEIFGNNDILPVREPGSTSLGEKIRSILQTEDNMPDSAELLLFEAARAAVVDCTISPALKAGKSVFCDRFYDSTTAYQGYGRGIALSDIEFLNQFAADGLEPDLTFLFDLDPEIGMARRGKPTDRIEAAGMAFHRKVRDGYLDISSRHSRFRVIDASQPLDVVVETVTKIIESEFMWTRKNKEDSSCQKA